MRLRIEIGDRRFEFRPEDSPVEVGRLANARVRLHHPLVSRSHGCFTWEGERWHYQDDSRHGTVLLGQGPPTEVARGHGVPLPDRCELLLAGSGGPRLRCEAVGATAPDPPRELFRRAVEVQTRGDWRAALRDFVELARHDPPVVEALRRAGACCEELGRLPEAILWATRYSFHRPRDPVAWKSLARLHGQRGELDDARHSLDRARALDPADPELPLLAADLGAASKAARVLELSTAEVLGPSAPQVLDTPHFMIHYDFAAHGRLLPDLAKALEAAVITADPYLPFPGGKISVSLLARAAFASDAPPLGDRSAAATCTQGGIQIYLPPGRARACRDTAYLVALAQHEVVHALLIEAGDGVPWWIHEGLAQFVSTGEHHPGCPPPPQGPPDLARYESAPPSAESEAAYALAHFAVAALDRSLGCDGLRKLLSSLVSGGSISETLTRADLPYAELERRAWSLWCLQAESQISQQKTLDQIPRRSP